MNTKMRLSMAGIAAALTFIGGDVWMAARASASAGDDEFVADLANLGIVATTSHRRNALAGRSSLTAGLRDQPRVVS